MTTEEDPTRFVVSLLSTWTSVSLTQSHDRDGMNAVGTRPICFQGVNILPCQILMENHLFSLLFHTLLRQLIYISDY